MKSELEFVVCTTPAGDVRGDAAVRNETGRPTPKDMADLSGAGIPVISRPLRRFPIWKSPLHPGQHQGKPGGKLIEKQDGKP